MTRKTNIAVIIGTMISMSFAGLASADPDGSQRLRGLGGRVFLVQVRSSFVGGSHYPDLSIGDGGGLCLGDRLLEEAGEVSAAKGKGTLQLSAFSQAIFVEFLGGDDLVVGEFVSVGHEVGECPL